METTEVMIGLLTRAREETARALTALERLIATEVEDDPSDAKLMLDRAQALMQAVILYDEWRPRK